MTQHLKITMTFVVENGQFSVPVAEELGKTYGKIVSDFKTVSSSIESELVEAPKELRVAVRSTDTLDDHRPDHSPSCYRG